MCVAVVVVMAVLDYGNAQRLWVRVISVLGVVGATVGRFTQVMARQG